MKNAIGTFFKVISFCVIVIVGSIFLFSHLDDTKSVSRNSNYQITMYSLSTCGNCTIKRRQLNKENIRFTEYFIDEDLNAGKQLSEKLAKAKVSGGSIGTPVFEVNGKMLVGNPSLKTIKKHM